MGREQSNQRVRYESRWKWITRASIALGVFLPLVIVGAPRQLAAQTLGPAIDISQGTGPITLDNVRCWVNSGVKHIIVKAAIDQEYSGTNHNRDTSKQQLETLWRAKYEAKLPITVDLYLYVHWPPNLNFSTPVADQVGEAIGILKELKTGSLPVGRLWIDLEEHPPSGQSVSTTVKLIGEAFNRCGSFPCGVYTRKDWWEKYTGNTTAFSAYPLWYARYSCPANTTFNDYDPFGGWTAPVAKQYDDGKCPGFPYLCGTPSDRNTMYLGNLSDLPKATGLSPASGTTISASADSTKLTVNAHSKAVRYLFQVQYLSNGTWKSYATYTRTGNATYFFFPYANTQYRWRVQYWNYYGVGSWSSWSFLNYGSPQRADLRVSTITFTSAPRAGIQTAAVARLTNEGTAASGTFAVKWYVDGAQVGYGGHGSLAPGETSSGNVRFYWTPTKGVHTLRFVADVNQQVQEIDEGNNSTTIAVTVPGPPDLKVSGITFTSAPKAGEQTVAVAQLSNVGESASGAFAVKWFLDGVQVGYGGHSSLGPGQVSSGNVKFYYTPTPGLHKLRFVADTDGHVKESNESNNSYETTFTVLSPPDLKVSGIRFSSPPKAGVQTVATAQLSNVGQTSSGVFAVKWFLDGAQVGYGKHYSIGPGQTSTGNVRFYFTPKPGIHKLRFVADSDNHVKESNEANNSYELTFVVGSLPDLRVSGISFTSIPRAGLTTTAVAQLANVGGSSSGTFNVKWYLNGVLKGYGFHTSLAPGQVSSNNVRFSWTPVPGTHTLRFEADVDKHVAESNESNNVFQITVTVSSQTPQATTLDLEAR